jgi:hypothetical protein
MKTRSGLLVLAVGLAVGTGCAREGITPFADLDTDNNGRVSREEAAGDLTLTGLFATVDEDSDGELTAREYLAATKR